MPSAGPWKKNNPGCDCCDECVPTDPCVGIIGGPFTYYCCCWNPDTKEVEALPTFRVAITNVTEGPVCSGCDEFFNVDIDLACGDDGSVEEEGDDGCFKKISWSYQPVPFPADLSVVLESRRFLFGSSRYFRKRFAWNWVFDEMPAYVCSDPDDPLASETIGQRPVCGTPTLTTAVDCAINGSPVDCAGVDGPCDIRDAEAELIEL